jgi:hypothetical protein
MSERRRMRRAPSAPERTADGPTIRQPAHAGLLMSTTDTGTRERTALDLQASAGNRAVAASITDINAAHAARPSVAMVNAVASVAAPPAGGVLQIGQTGGMKAAGVTTLPEPGSPDVVIGAPLQQADGTWQAKVNGTSVKPDAATSLFPGPGLHDDNPTETGIAVHRDVTPAASDEIKRGEEEHLLDLEFARDFAYDRVADAVNRVSAGGPATGKSAAEAKQNAMDQVRGEVPAQSRWPDGVDPVLHWRRLYGKLVAVTRDRDTNGWHNMSSEFVLDDVAKKKLGVPKEDELVRYRAGTTQVGKHPSGPEVQARYDGLPAGPAPTAKQPTTTNTPGVSPAGDYNYTPNGTAYAVTAGPARRPRRDRA